MHLIVGLGNPGSKYIMTRHNVGFMIIDALLYEFGNGGSYKTEHKADTAKITIDIDGKPHPVLIAKPQTFMNLSGESVIPLMNYYNIAPENLLVVHDEIEIDFKKIRYQFARGHAGHNGIRSIHAQLGHNNYGRLKLGVSRPPGKQDVANYLLSNFNKEEIDELPNFLGDALGSIPLYIKSGWQKAANQFNGQ